MSKTQYLAIRKVLDDEISSSPGDTEMLQTILEILVDHPSNYSAEDRETVLAKANMVAPAILAKSSTREDVSKDWMKSLKAGLLGVSVAALVIVSPAAAKTIAINDIFFCNFILKIIFSPSSFGSSTNLKL